MLNLTLIEQLRVWQIGHIGNAIGNANLVRAIFDESEKFWDRAINAETGGHVISGKISNDQVKRSAIADYALQVAFLFTESRHPVLSLHTKRAFALNAEMRAAALNSNTSKVYVTNDELFKMVMIDILCFDPHIVEMALAIDNDIKVKQLVWFIGSLNGDIRTEEDYTFEHDDLYDLLKGYNVIENREGFVNECFQYIYSGKGRVNEELPDSLYEVITRGIGE